jgi:hypothetical protein
MWEIISNPMFIAIFVGTITYAYMWWANEQRYRRNKLKKKPVNIIIPAIVTIVVWGVVYGYNMSINKNASSLPELDKLKDIPILELNNPKPQMASQAFKIMEPKEFIPASVANGLTSSAESVKSYQLVGKGLNIPSSKLPDVFIETY